MISIKIAREHGTRMANPFATRYVRPGALAYRFPPDASPASLVATLAARHWRGAIVGPHGSGKSTLLAALRLEIERAGRNVSLIELHNGQRRLPRNSFAQIAGDRPVVIVVDGYEQLSWWSRRTLAAFCLRRKLGLLITVHNAAAAPHFPVLFRTQPNLECAQHLAAELCQSGPSIDPSDVAAAYCAQRGNIREVFFALYDLVEHRRREPPSPFEQSRRIASPR